MKSARPIVAVSGCLLGEKVRYDGRDKRNALLLGPLAVQFEYLSFCPEVAIGLPVPRPAMHLVDGETGVRVLGVADRTAEATDALRTYGRAMTIQFAGVCGVVFKSRSPSCGLASTPLHDQEGNVIGATSGAFAAEIAMALPSLPMADEEELADPQRCAEFVRRVQARYKAGL